LGEKTRAIDHVVLPVTTLTLARSRLTSLGFTVAPDARHPFGTGNCCVFFENRTFLEPITIVDRTAADMAAAQGMFFVKRIKRFNERHGEGFAMLALNSADAEADHRAFEGAGIAAGDIHRFARKATLPDGAEREVGFALVPAETPAAPDATFFATQHLVPDALFQPAYIQHPNGAVGIAAVAAVAAEPGEFRAFLEAATGSVEIRSGASGVEAIVGGHSISILTQTEFRTRYGIDSPDPRRGLLYAACDLSVIDLDRAAGYAGPTAIRRDSRVIIPPSPGLGAVIAFKARPHG
jgi:hypothetical protein